MAARFAALLTLVFLWERASSTFGKDVESRSGSAQVADIVVAADGSGDFTTVAAALKSIPRANRERKIVLVKQGTYQEKVRIEAACVTLLGEGRDATRIEFSLLNDEFIAKPDAIGRAVVNVAADDFVLENITVANTAGVVGQHAFAVYGDHCDRTVIVDCDVLSDGADTLSLWDGKRGRYYHARCKIRGAVDFVCPRGWCYLRDCTFYETKTSAAMWHDGHQDRDMKFVLRNCTFDGVPGWSLARHHADAALYFLDCQFSKSMIDKPPKRVVYPLGSAPATQADLDKNRELDAKNQWGERAYFFHCQRAGGDFPWFADNLTDAPDKPTAEQITAKWTFRGGWDPESTAGPRIEQFAIGQDDVTIQLSEPVTVKGKPIVMLSAGGAASYSGGSGTSTLTFSEPGVHEDVKFASLDLNGGRVIASQASAAIRDAVVTLPQDGDKSCARRLRQFMTSLDAATDPRRPRPR